MKYKEFVKQIWDAVEKCPGNWRKGQKVFNVMEALYGDVARQVQFIDHVDCFYDDKQIEPFIDQCWIRVFSQEKMSRWNLEKTAEEYANKEHPDEPCVGKWGTGDYEPPIDREYDREIAKDAFKAGAEWAMHYQEKKIADAYEKGKQEGIRVVRSWESSPGQVDIKRHNDMNTPKFKEGDWIKRKKDGQIARVVMLLKTCYSLTLTDGDSWWLDYDFQDNWELTDAPLKDKLEEAAEDFVWEVMENDEDGISELSRKLRPSSKISDFYDALAEFFKAGAKWMENQFEHCGNFPIEDSRGGYWPTDYYIKKK